MKKSVFEKNENEREYNRAIDEANEAKDRLASIAEKLFELGFERKAKSCMTLVYKIESWQNTGR